MAGGSQFSLKFSTNAGALAQKKRLLAAQVRAGLCGAAKGHAEKRKAVAIQLSSGTLTPSDMRRLGHPYALRFTPDSAPFPDFFIDQVSGVFKASWQARVQEAGRGWTITVLNTAPESRFLMGSKSARMRPILLQIDTMTAGDLRARTGRVTRRAAP